ncbi:MAG: hypothetical protein GWP70_06815 [Proteobacteria bacterium]|nr:hypothetical protein [Pseudomonadota bacterium]
MSVQLEHASVVIVGAGPIGLTASCLLSQAGIKHILLEQNLGLHQWPQAHVVSARTMEILRAAGISEPAMRENATPLADMSYLGCWAHTLAKEPWGGFALLSPENADYLGQVMVTTPTPNANIPQNKLEKILHQHAQAAPLGDIRFGHQLQSHVQNGEGVIASIRNHEDDTSYEINADFLIACDGAGSAVRHQCGIEMHGPRNLQHWATVVLQADFRHLVKAHPGLLYWTYGPERTGLFIAYDIDDQWVYMHACEEGQEITDEQPEQWVRTAVGDDTPFKIVHTDRWSMSAQVAQHFRDGRIFLAGDAAHRFPPTGGMGMNTGMQDVFNLCWKIARIVNDDSALALLDSYEIERRPSVEKNCEQSRVNFEKMSQVEEAIGISSNVEKTRENLNLLDIDDTNSQQRRDRIQQSINAQRDHFFMLGMDLGVCYDGALIQTCPEDAPKNNWQASEYNPSTAAGNRLPHCWLQDGDTRLSTHDIVASVKLTLLTTSDGYQQWAQALADTGTDDIEIQAIGNAGLAPADDGWATLIGMKQHGALLIRPDRHIAFGTDHFSENTCKDIFRLLQNYRGENHE